MNTTSSDPDSPPERPRLFFQVLAGFIGGIAAGLFFGESAAVIKFLGDAYIGLLQMSVLPYVVISLIVGIGRLNPQEAMTILLRMVGAIAALWLLILFTAVVVPLGFPDWEAASYFSTAMVEVREPVDFLGIYIPSNPFSALAETTVPAIVVFSVAVGVALMGVPGKETLLRPLDTLGQAIRRIAGFIVRLSPLGVFAIAASAAGTIRVEEFERLQVYFFTSIVAWTILTFWALPMFVASRSPLRYRAIMRHLRSPLLTAFATGTLLVVLPMLATAAKRILEDSDLVGEDDAATVDIIVPASYSVPSGALFLTVVFVIFAAWASGAALGPAEVPAMAALSTFAAFSGTHVAIPYLLDLYRIPSDMFQLFLTSNVILERLWTMFGALFIVLLTLIVVLGRVGRFRLLPRVPLIFLLPTAAGTVGAMLLTGFVIGRAIDHEYGAYDAFINRDLLTTRVATRQLEQPPAALASEDRERPRIAVLRERGTLRVGYVPDSLPYAFRNSIGRVVGLDIELAHVLAGNLGVGLDLVRIEYDDMVPWLRDGRIDIVMSGLLVSPALAQDLSFSRSYLTETAAIVVRDHLRHRYAEYVDVLALKEQRVGYAIRGVYSAWVGELYPDFEVVELASPRPFFRDETDDLDALVYTAERGSAWTLLYPAYSVVVPEPLRHTGPLSFALPRGQEAWLDYVNTWLAYETPDRVPYLFGYWVQGESPPGRERRWSILEDVLGWSR